MGVFHDGELEVQRLAGTRGVAQELMRGIDNEIDVDLGRNAMFGELTNAFLATTSKAGEVWVSQVEGEPGFLQAPDPHRLQMHIDEESFVATDPSIEILRSEDDALAAVLAINFEKRRRYRTVGVGVRLAEGVNKMEMRVKEAFNNCPKYIQRRRPTEKRQGPRGAVSVSKELSDEAIALIEKADTLMLGTVKPGWGADMNQRGGNPGFVRVASGTEVYWPEYRGNGMFQSSGNILVNNKAGLLFVDYEGTGDVLQLTGEASLDWSVALEGSNHAIRFHITQARLYRNACNYKWELIDRSDYNPAVLGKGDQMAEGAKFPKTVKLVKIVRESDSVKTFRFLAPEPVKFLPGQYASFDFDIPGIGEVTRTWTLSETANSSEGDVTLEVSVKRKPGGLISNWLHDNAQLGFKGTLTGVDGDLSPMLNLDNVPDKVLLISGGVGITPMMAILRGLRAFSLQTKVIFIHSERHECDRPFKSELARRGRTDPDLKLVRTITSSDEAPQDGIIHGRINKELLSREVDDLASYETFVCGPDKFMDEVPRDLVDMGLPPAKLHLERFNF